MMRMARNRPTAMGIEKDTTACVGRDSALLFFFSLCINHVHRRPAAMGIRKNTTARVRRDSSVVNCIAGQRAQTLGIAGPIPC